MSQIVIIADDLTGANATSVLIARQGYKSATFLDLNVYSDEQHKNFNVISISTDSRAVKENIAYDRVKRVVNFFKDKDVKLISKRIDSTLRGNIGVEIDAVLDTLNGDEVAIVVSAFPSSRRITIGGFLMVNSIPLEKTDVAKDPKTPVYTSFVTKLIKQQSKYSVGSIKIDKVLQGEECVEKEILAKKKKGNRIIVVDATTDEDIRVIAKACKKSKLPIVAVDPGPFTSALTMEIVGVPNVVHKRKIMLTLGSVTNLTRKQLEVLKMKYNPLLVYVDSKALIYEHTRQDEVKRIVDLLISQMDGYSMIGITTTGNEDDILNLKELAKNLNTSEHEIAHRISTGLALITRMVLEYTDNVIGGLYTSGGDVTVAVCKELKAAGIEVKDEVLPLAAYGRLIGGKYSDIHIITKGGLVGENDALIKCMEYLKAKI
jgi:uncharacterized protein YgbK (DUF1537 family)